MTFTPEDLLRHASDKVRGGAGHGRLFGLFVC